MPPLPKSILLKRLREREETRRREAAATPIAAKVSHVRRAGQTREHHCHGGMPGCAGQCPPAMWGCRSCWLRLPKRLRDRIWAAYRPGQEETMTPSAEYLTVAREVQLWIREHHPNATEQ